MENKPKSPKRIIFNVDPEFHKFIKISSTNRNMSISQYVKEAIAWRLRYEEKSKY